MSKGEILGLVSGKGGVGKTSTCVNLGVALQNLDKDVTLVDTDFSSSNLGVYLSRYDHPVKLQDVLDKNIDVEKAEFDHLTGLKIVPSSNKLEQTHPNTENIKEVFQKISKDRDYVLVDCAPGIDQNLSDVMKACDNLIIITEPTQTSCINAAQIIEKAKELEIPVYGTIINKAENNPDKELVDREIELMTESSIIGKIPYDPLMKESLFENKPLVETKPLAPASIQIQKIAAKLTGNEYKPPKFPKLRRKINSLI